MGPGGRGGEVKGPGGGDEYGLDDERREALAAADFGSDITEDEAAEILDRVMQGDAPSGEPGDVGVFSAEQVAESGLVPELYLDGATDDEADTE